MVVNEELKFLCKFKEIISRGGGGLGGGGGGGGDVKSSQVKFYSVSILNKES